MTRYVIDAATLLHIVANEIRIGSVHQLVAPNLIRSQALTLLLEEVRRGDLDENLALQHHERLTELKMRLLGDRVSRRTAWKIAREQGWDTTFDAEYLPSPNFRPTLSSPLTAHLHPRRKTSSPWHLLKPSPQRTFD